MTIAVENTYMHSPKSNLVMINGELIFLEIKTEAARSHAPSVENFLKWWEPIIISRTEVINNGDWCYVKDVSFTGIAQVTHIGPAGIVYFGKQSVCYGKHELPDKVWKILVLPERFSYADKERMAKNELKKGEVAVECVDNTYTHQGTGKYWEDEPVKMKKYLDFPEKYVKFNAEGHAIVYEVNKTNENSLEKLATILEKHGVRRFLNQNQSGYSQIERDIVDTIGGDYSKEDVKSLIVCALTELADNTLSGKEITRWFEINLK